MNQIPFKPKENACISHSFNSAGFTVIRFVGNKVYTDKGNFRVVAEDLEAIKKWGTCCELSHIRFYESAD